MAAFRKRTHMATKKSLWNTEIMAQALLDIGREQKPQPHAWGGRGSGHPNPRQPEKHDHEWRKGQYEQNG